MFGITQGAFGNIATLVVDFDLRLHIPQSSTPPLTDYKAYYRNDNNIQTVTKSSIIQDKHNVPIALLVKGINAENNARISAFMVNYRNTYNPKVKYLDSHDCNY